MPNDTVAIQMVDLHQQYLRIKTEIDEAMQQVIDSTAFIQGKEVSQFASQLGSFLECPFVIPCANGTDALQIAMMALDLKPGDEVILPVHTYVATAEVIALLGLKPVFVDVDEHTFNIDPSQIENKITSKTACIVPVHLYGQCADMESIMKIAEAHDLHVIEDAAQALGADYIYSSGKRKKAGTIGTIGTTSFFPSKNLGCFGDGGAIFCGDQKLFDKIRMIANHGQKVKYQHDIVGVNSRLDTIQAAILSVKLRYINEYTLRRNEAAAYYDSALSSINELDIPVRSASSTHVFHQYTLKIKGKDRNDLKEYLKTKGIPTMIYYPAPVHMQPAYRQDAYGVGSFPIAEALSRQVISLPIHTEMSDEQLLYIAKAIKEFF